jgi:hypothetical protein
MSELRLDRHESASLLKASGNNLRTIRVAEPDYKPETIEQRPSPFVWHPAFLARRALGRIIMMKGKCGAQAMLSHVSVTPL